MVLKIIKNHLKINKTSLKQKDAQNFSFNDSEKGSLKKLSSGSIGEEKTSEFANGARLIDSPDVLQENQISHNDSLRMIKEIKKNHRKRK